ncbi:Type 1 glutamine amidotransferase-like domain-containing protein [Lactococcus lactis]|uniref:Type 1 glutamine amidotransferase-like domain-containing protein n=1 Tax=Lactococcus lactis TaxID=1358 RepID=UPI00071D5B1B|nr:Type 1 glutamine amidotransferase-like domain-containing protein [Lactococcus lactis]KST91956.1 Peptidase E [Lactococcus lactis subsp. lactis]KST95081.1 Peptidase E [Lactococcus lactis subsp. lactis]KSU15065.1 Peptidase E [Lactococcus lactis subsp. lactis]MCT0054053.1 dipeptidase E [Lactococcus lactis subsp. lactis]MDG4955175.1 Type 1 glutamine amidotransferase-like domain-containing protein [Lactococcus lactis]
MKYFLTSNPLLTKDQKLNPSNEFVDNLKRDIPEMANALFICSDPNSYGLTDKFSEEMKTCFFNSGFNFKKFKVLDNRNAKGKSELINEAEVVILAGGHVPTQNQFFQQINLKNELKNSNKIIIGFSAGSMNCSEEVYAQPELPGESLSPNYKRFLKGLGITKSQILPHYNLVKNEYLDGKKLFEEITYPDSFGRAFITLNDGSYLYGDGQYEIVYGESLIISDGTIKK